MQKIPLRKVLTLLCPTLSSLCLVIGCQRLGLTAAGIGLLVLLTWLAARRWTATWTVSPALALSTAACVFGVVSGGSTYWLMISAALGLASWDLILLNVSLAGNPPSYRGERMEKLHYQSLALALVSGLLLAVGGSLIRLRIPFIFMLLLVGLAFFSLDRLLRVLNRGTQIRKR